MMKKMGPKSKKIKRARNIIKSDIFPWFHFSHSLAADMSPAAEIAFFRSQFDIFAQRPIQTSVFGTIKTAYKRTAPVDQNDLEFLIPADTDTYIDLDIKLYIRG